MGALRDYAANKVIKAEFGATANTPPAVLYLSLHTADPGETGASEVTASDYARLAVSNNPTNWIAGASAGSIKNAADLLFAAAVNAWGTITHVGIWDAASGGNLRWKGALTIPKVVNANGQFRFSAGTLVASVH